MPARRVRKSNRPLRRKRVNRRVARSRMFNPSPIFTESFALPKVGGGQYLLAPNAGGVLGVSMNDIPQLAQYNTLYQKYRILKAKFICIPAWNTAAADANSELAPGGQTYVGLSRVVFAINDSPNQITSPANENVVLADNGCKIVCGSPKLTMSCRPVPNTQDANGVQMTYRDKYINFNNAGPDVAHFGITWWHTQPVLPGGQGYGVPYFVYVKLTFQLSDPR